MCVLGRRIPLELIQKIAEENNLPETAFVVKDKGNYELRLTSMIKKDNI
ncbi:hypothetical protein [Clostridioides difficile]